MSAKVREIPEAGQYPKGRTVEAALVRHGISATEGAAHQLLLRMHRSLGPIAECFVEAGASERALGFSWARYKRVAHRAIARTMQKLRAGDAMMGPS